MLQVKERALALIDRNMTTFTEAGEYIDSAAAVTRARQTVAEIDALVAQSSTIASNQVLSMRREAWGQGIADVEFASHRLPGHLTSQLQASFGQVLPEAAFAAVQSPVLGVTPDAMFNGVRAGTTQNMQNLLVNAVLSGESVEETGRKISQSLDVSVAAGERIARTNVNAAYNEAQKSIYDSNPDIFAGYQWEATLDDRTSQVCFMLHGSFWPLGSKTPGPPAHWNCRSILIPVFKDEGVQQMMDNTLRRARTYTKDGEQRDILLPGTITPEQWARRQPSEVTLRITGSKLKNSLFRRNLIGFDDLVDPSLRVRTDEEIIRRAAGLHPSNASLRKTARSMGVKRFPTEESLRRADTRLQNRQPWAKPEPTPRQVEEAIPPKPVSKPPEPVEPEIAPVRPPERRVRIRTDRNEDLTFDRAMDLDTELHQTFPQFVGTRRFDELEKALTAQAEEGFDAASIVARNDLGVITGSISWEIDEGILTIVDIGVLDVPGASGAELIRYAVKEAVEKDLTIRLFSTPEAVGFYRRLGFIPDAKVENVFRATRSRLRKISEALGAPGRVR
jgi:SPP1 gp7 family putative phage head morphogenesis protein